MEDSLLVTGIDDLALHRAFGVSTLARGRSYAASGYVLGATEEQHGTVTEIRGSVIGTQPVPYQVLIEVEGPTIRSWCSCPVGRECKHAVAVIWARRSAASMVPVDRRQVLYPTTPVAGWAPVDTTPAWQRALDGVLDDLERPEPLRTRTRLGLRFELPPPRRRQWGRGAEQQLWLRAVRAGARNNWVKTGISWRNATQPHLDVTHDPDQLAVLAQVARSFGGAPGRDVLPLEQVGPNLLDLLDEELRVRMGDRHPFHPPPGNRDHD